MGILFTGKHNLRAWEYALFEGKNNYFVLPDVKLYERLTEQQISNDCRIILDSVEICQTTKNHETFAEDNTSLLAGYLDKLIDEIMHYTGENWIDRYPEAKE
jgi:hypothetical protein